jgi:hypothetical protein
MALYNSAVDNEVEEVKFHNGRSSVCDVVFRASRPSGRNEEMSAGQSALS